MNEFYVDYTGMNGLYNLLVRASDDAAATLAYTNKHCDLDWPSKGLLMMLLGPHKHVYESVTTALSRLNELAQGAGTQINQAQLAYARTDQAAAAGLDATYPGAKDPASLRGTLVRGRPDLQPARTAFSDVAGPTARLTNPEYAVGVEMWQLNPLTDLLSPAAWLRQVCIWLFGHDPLEGWAEQFSGDWRAYTHCAAALGTIGAAVFDTGKNLVAGSADVSTVWRGNAAEAEQEFQLALGSAAMGLESACQQYSDLYLRAAEAVKSLFDVVSGLISDLLDVLIIINVASAAGTALIETGIGAVAGYGVAAYYAFQAYDLYHEISRLYSNAENMIKATGASISSIQAKLAIRDLPTLQPYRHPAGQ